MKFFKLITTISLIVLLSACGRNGPRVPYKGYPKTYPAPTVKAKTIAPRSRAVYGSKLIRK